MKVLTGSPRLPCGPAATPRAGPLRGRFLRPPKKPLRTLRRSQDTEAPAADSQSSNSLQGALKSATDLLSSAGSSVKHVLASPTETTKPPSRESADEAQTSSSNGASSGHGGASNPLDDAAKRVKLAAKAITGQPVHSVAASVDEITSGAREAGEGLQGEADKMEGQLKSALSSRDPVNEAATSDEQQGQLEEGANFLDKAGAVVQKVTGLLRGMAPSSNGSGAVDSDGDDLVESVSDHLGGAGETVQKMGTSVHRVLASASGHSMDENPEDAKRKLPRSRPSAVANFILDQFLPLGLLVAMCVGYSQPALGASFAGDELHAWLIAAGFLLVGLAPTSRARVSADALLAWLRLALRHLDAWRCRYVWPRSGLAAAAIDLQTNSTIGIFMIQGMNLRRGEAAKALLSYKATLYGAVSILFITPLFALAALRMPFLTPEFAFGLAVFCCMPTTLSSGVSLTQAVGGNAALALLLTVSTNLAGIFTMPFVLCGLLGAGRQALALAPGALLRNLLRTILAPLLVGAAARAFVPGLAQQVDSNKRAMSLASACLLITVPWMQISKVAASGVAVSPAAVAAVVAAGALLHVAFLVLNSTACRALQLGGGSNPDNYVQEGMGGLSKRQQREQEVGVERAVVLVASQKTLPVAVTVLNQLAAAMPGPIGLAVIPCVISHLVQIVLDSLLVSWWNRRDADGDLMDHIKDTVCDESVLTAEHNHS